MTPVRGKLALVVGPSGAGKDTLIAGAKARLAHDPRFVFPRREITRAADAGGEDHVAVTPEDFRRRRAAGDYALAWEAHDLGYGVPASIVADLTVGRTVVVNVSRTVIADARARFGDVRVLNITAPAEVLAARLIARGRETADDVAQRVARAEVIAVTGEGVVDVVNDSGVEAGVDRFVAALKAD